MGAPAVETMTFPGSSNLAAATYDRDEQELTIEFVSGDEYKYLSVPDNVYRSLCSAPSAGSYFSRSIRGVYAYEQQ